MNFRLNKNDDELKFLPNRIVERSNSPIRNPKVTVRRRKALLIDSSNSAFNDIDSHFDRNVASTKLSTPSPQPDVINEKLTLNVEQTVPPESEVKTRRRNSFEAALDSLLPLDDFLRAESTHSSDIDTVDSNAIEQTNRSKSAEDLLSVMKTEDDEKFHFLDNFKQILDHESKHLVLLKTINKFKHILKESKVSDEVLTSIFYNVEDLIDAQNNLIVCLQNLITEWDLKKHLFTDIMDLYVLLHNRCKEYVKNIAHATNELRALFEKNEKFSEAMNSVVYDGSPVLLEVLIAKPTNWLCNSLENIKNLIDAAEGQCNLKMVKETWKQLKDNSESRLPSATNTIEKNVFHRSAIFVELLPNDMRNLRHVFLFSGMMVCAKQKLQSATNESKFDATKPLMELKLIERLDVKWFIPIQNLVIHPSKVVENCDKRKLEISNLKDKIRDYKIQLIAEKSKISEGDRQSTSLDLKRSKSHNISLRKKAVTKEIEKLQSLILRAQTDLMQLSPTISFIVSNLTEKPHTMLVFSVKDLELWKREITISKREQKAIETSTNTLASVNSFLDSYRRYSSIIEVANAPMLRNINEESISGVVVTTIDSVDGLNPVYSYYLTIEVDSFNLNEVKARTKKRTNDSKLCWNESFDIELDCSQSMNILLYQVKNFALDKESLLGYFEFKLDLKDLDNQTITKTTSMFGEDSSQLQIKVSFKMKTRNDLMKRQPSMMKTSLFGISLRSVVAREKSKFNPPVENVPLIIHACLKKIEEEGLDEEGIYRISGSKNDIQEFYKRLNKNVVNALKDIGNYDLHTTTGIVKLFLRELPEPLMLTENYDRLKEISNIVEDEERNNQYSEIIRNLSEPNHSTVIYVLKHFQRVCEHSDKNHMVASNLGLIIGPTLMMPPCNNEKPDHTNFAMETMNSMFLSRVCTQILNGVCAGTVVIDHS